MEKKIKAIGVQSPGSIENFQNVEIKMPKLNPRDILVKVKAVSLNSIDYKRAVLGYHPDIPLKPLVVGFDASGIVEEIGQEVQFYKVGDEVMYSGELTRQGSYSEYQVVDERIVGKKPKTLDFNHAAAYPLVSLTAWEGLIQRMKIPFDSQGKYILIIGGSGGVGSIAIQIAKKILGLKVIASASRPETVKFCADLGADFIINHHNEFDKELEKVGIKEVDYIFNTQYLTDEKMMQIGRIIKPFGVIGSITGFRNLTMPQSYIPLVLKSVTFALEQTFTRPLYKVELEKQKKILDKIADLIDEKKIQNIVTVQMDFNLDNIKKGHKMLESGKNIGKVVLTNVDNYFKNI